jgi:hypothetical protein
MSKNQVDKGNSPSSKETKGKEKTLFVQVPLEVLEANISTSAMKLYLVLLKDAIQLKTRFSCYNLHKLFV